MYNFYVPPQSFTYLKNKFPEFPWQQMTVNVAIDLNNFLQENAQYMLVFMDTHFKEYIPIIVSKVVDDNIVIMFEFLYNPVTNLAEIYNICTHIQYRRQGYAKGLNKAFDVLQNMLQCNLWIAVALNNPMYKIAVDTYINMGFINDVKITYKTPSDIMYPSGFMEMRKNLER